MTNFEDKKSALKFLKIIKTGFKILNINVVYNKNDNLEVLNAIIDLNYKKLRKLAKETKGIPFNEGDIQ